MNEAKLISLPAFENPPVIEVVCGIVFEAIKGFRAHHLGLFWQMVRDEFPDCEHAIRLGFPKEQLDLANYLPRVWFISEDKHRLIQLQDNRLLFNWRKTETGEDYPHYIIIIKAFSDYLGIFQKFLKEKALGTLNPESCELTYINHILKGWGWESLSDINSIFPDFAWNSTSERFLPEPLQVSGQIRFSLPDDKGNLSLTLQQGERKSDKVPILILNNSAQGLGANKSLKAVWEWFEVAHEWIVRGFADLTGPKIQRDVWRRRDAK